MILTFKESVAKYGNQYQTEKRVQDGEIFRLEAGVYSTEKYVPEEAILMKKYPKAVLSGDYAFYFHNLTDVAPDDFTLATSSKAAKIPDPRVKQQFVRDDLLYLGAKQEIVDGYSIIVYDRERMLIELLRNKHCLPYDYYKEIISNYRKIIIDLEIWRIQEYADIFPKSKLIHKALAEEVF